MRSSGARFTEATYIGSCTSCSRSSDAGVGAPTVDGPQARPHALLDGLPTGEGGLHAYFVHSYHLVTESPDTLLATTDYGGPVTACVGRDNLFGTQFHPEKSAKDGLRLLHNFLRWNP